MEKLLNYGPKAKYFGKIQCLEKKIKQDKIDNKWRSHRPCMENVSKWQKLIGIKNNKWCRQQCYIEAWHIVNNHRGVVKKQDKTLSLVIDGKNTANPEKVFSEKIIIWLLKKCC